MAHGLEALLQCFGQGSGAEVCEDGEGVLLVIHAFVGLLCTKAIRWAGEQLVPYKLKEPPHVEAWVDVLSFFFVDVVVVIVLLLLFDRVDACERGTLTETHVIIMVLRDSNERHTYDGHAPAENPLLAAVGQLYDLAAGRAQQVLHDEISLRIGSAFMAQDC